MAMVLETVKVSALRLVLILLTADAKNYPKRRQLQVQKTVFTPNE